MSSVPGWRPLALPLAACLTVASATTLVAAEDKRPVGRTFIEAAPEATKDVVVGGQQTWNVYFSCSNGADTVEPGVSISPNLPGQFTLKFNPDPVGTSPASTVLTVQTNLSTRPRMNGYELTIYGNGTKCASYPPVTPKPILMVRPKIVMADEDGPAVNEEVWWFAGESPTDYLDRRILPLTPYPPPREFDKYTWTITTGSDYAKFVNSPASTLTTSAEIVRVLAKTAPPANSGNVSVTVKVNGVPSNPIGFKVKTPRRLVYKFTADKTDPDVGPRSFIHYEIRDQFGKLLPVKVAWNISSIGNPLIISDFPNENWHSTFTVLKSHANPLDLTDEIGCIGQCTIPAWVSPHHPQRATKVQHQSTAIYIGGPNRSRGVKVEKLVSQQFRGYGRHCKIKSPPDAATLNPECPGPQ